jgi:hypothetical protein
MTLIRASEAGAALDTDLLTGGGTDDTAVLQGILDRARDGDPVHLVLDGPALVRGLDVHGNTTIEGTAGAGLYLADGSERTVLRNANRTRDEVVDRDIVIHGLFVNGNRTGQVEANPFGSSRTRMPQIDRDGALKSGIEFFGVERLTLERVTVFNQRSFGIWIATAKHVTMRDIEVDANFPEYPGTASAEEQRAFLDGMPRSNLDGLHINGPSSHILVDGARFRCEDDAIAVNGNDAESDDMIPANEVGPYVGQGPVTDVVIRNIVLMDSIQGIRLLSSDQRVDRILIENASGSVRNQMAQLTNFHHVAQGNFGSVTFRNINIDPLPCATWAEVYPDWMAASPQGEGDGQIDMPLFSLRAKIDHLVIDGVSAKLVDSRPLLRLGNNADVGVLEATFSVEGDPDQIQPLKIVAPGRVRDLRLAVESRPHSAPALGKD